jgi:hypothetical protein
MKNNLNSFPNNKIIIFLLTFLMICCKNESINVIESSDFINIYAQILIINELKISKDKKDAFISDLLNRNNITRQDLNLAIESFKQKPEEWVSILQKVRDKIREYKKDEYFLQSRYSGAVNEADRQADNHENSPEP